jgi:hypothetical protein
MYIWKLAKLSVKGGRKREREEEREKENIREIWRKRKKER